MIEKLVKQGFVSRDQGTKDRRKIVLTITDQGRKVAVKNYQHCIKKLETIFSQLERKDTAKLKAALRMMEEVLTKINVEPGGR
jgi:DNA-binding MarR family transcriptional regulator